MKCPHNHCLCILSYLPQRPGSSHALHAASHSPPPGQHTIKESSWLVEDLISDFHNDLPDDSSDYCGYSDRMSEHQVFYLEEEGNMQCKPPEWTNQGILSSTCFQNLTTVIGLLPKSGAQTCSDCQIYTRRSCCTLSS